jgi:hypothetical protein
VGYGSVTLLGVGVGRGGDEYVVCIGCDPGTNLDEALPNRVFRVGPRAVTSLVSEAGLNKAVSRSTVV